MSRDEILQQVYAGTMEIVEVNRRQPYFRSESPAENTVNGYEEEKDFLKELKKAGLSLLNEICCCSNGGAA